MPEVHEGGCLCGAIRYCIKGNPQPLRAMCATAPIANSVPVVHLPLSLRSKRRMSSQRVMGLLHTNNPPPRVIVRDGHISAIGVELLSCGLRTIILVSAPSWLAR